MKKQLLALLSLFFGIYFIAKAQITVENPHVDSLFNLEKYDESAKLYYTEFYDKVREGKFLEAQHNLQQWAVCNYRLKEFQTVIDTLDKWLSILEYRNDVDALLISKSYTFLALSFRKMERYGEALNSYKHLIQYLENRKINDPILAFAYKNASQIYERRLDYDKSIQFLGRALESDSTGKYKSSIYQNLIRNYYFLKKIGLATYYINLGSVLIDVEDDEKADLESASAAVFMLKGDYLKTEMLLKSVLNFHRNDHENWKNRFSCFVGLAEVSEVRGLQEKTILYYKMAIEESVKLKSAKDREMAKLYCSMGLFFKNQNLLDSALSHYQQALIQVFPKFNSTNIADNPDLKDVYTESWIMTAAARKAEALLLRYQQKGNIADLHNAAHCFDLSLAAVKLLHKSYGSENAKLYMGDYSHTYFEEAIEVNYLLYTLTGDRAKLQKIFALMEQSKASVLSEAIQKNKALLLMGIPDSLLGLEQDLRITIAELTTQMQNSEVEGQDHAAEAEKLKMQLSDANLKYERLIEKMKADYPNFRSYVEEMPLPSFEDIRARLLNDNSLFMEYFSGGKALYCLTIGRNGASIFKVDRTANFDALMQDYLAFFKNADAIVADPEGYLCTAHELYNALFSKALRSADSRLTNLLIVPDGLLGYLPFDALVTSDGGMSGGFGNVDFLLKKYGLRYGYSANVLLQQSGNRLQKGKLLRVMPRFLEGERGLSPLAYSDEETVGVRSWQSLDGALATKAGFKELASQSRLIHLSTHAESNSGQGEPHIELADGQLLLPELYAMNLSAADLVVLSACETGLGKLEKGEGVMSLARGFAYAGANSLVASLWKVNERSTATLFAHFYQYLAEGKTKSEALRLAKLFTLENAGTDARQSPYYWAGFVFMGNDGEVDLPLGWPDWRVVLPLAVAGLAGGVFYLRKRRRRLIA